MSFEIERKFLVRNDAWQHLTTGASSLRQAYLTGEGKASIRIRIKDDSKATLSIKSRPAELRRLELEYPVPMLDAEALMTLRNGCVIRKVRHHVPCGELTWEVDVFEGDNAGLVIAEIELRHEGETFELPDWIGPEVTGQRQYYNSALVKHPFSAWPSDGDHTPRATEKRA